MYHIYVYNCIYIVYIIYSISSYINLSLFSRIGFYFPTLLILLILVDPCYETDQRCTNKSLLTPRVRFDPAFMALSACRGKLLTWDGF
jgi:hypothetical protein